ncbi:MAG: hypothetical protein A2487_06885 [Candidatus Raymondbacteria bacterium RifOxyC12_full_50_8]|nr:MAG: hypothetical protein A2248_07590 [Candidatus Raymondbacteria bacterium RIFOXYA2_FULL_49_16]OGJ94637.1 MAG: hypothetical protein A2487_06885 [Candidatus Raymondbacteria bacterium RifOxyC12_full_50_8]OGJ96130.1 MAG: hypothetical protein A2453_09445 [Candidatus Raymondbacteria bacterium RIFOXYC2_FULL_50_21]OGP41137.1 MAG: hypothetical protein A2324_09840 [Candidatus Raymondbacteria bacterium RIFOXYB2_FULL_49_35]
MKILVVNEYLDQATGGATLYVIKVIQSLIERGHDVSVIHGHKEPLEAYKGAHHFLAFPGMLGKVFSNDPVKMDSLKSAVLTINPEVIYIHQIHNPAFISFVAEHWPTVRFEHGIDLTCPTSRRMSSDFNLVCDRKAGWPCQLFAYTQKCMPRNIFLGLKRIREMKSCLSAHAHVRRVRVASAFVKSMLIKQGMDPDKIVVLPYFTEFPARIERSVDWDMPEILYVGRLVAEKGPQMLFAAAEKVAIPLRLSILGSGPQLEELKKIAAKPGWRHRVDFHDWVDNTHISGFYRRAALLVVPSLNLEAFGINGIEAMAHGVPSVAFDVGGIRDWLAHGETGLIVPRNNSAALAQAITQLVTNRSQNEQWGLRGREIAEQRYTHEQHMEQLEKIFSEALHCM